MQAVRSFVVRHFCSILLLIICSVMAFFVFQEHQAAKQAQLANQEGKARFITSHGLLATALAEDTLSLENHLLAVQECAVIQRELPGYKQNGADEAKWTGLIQYYDSVERYLTKTVTNHYPNCPRGEALVLSQKDQSIVDFIRNSSQRVYDTLKGLDATDRSVVDDAYSAIGAEFEATFHTFDRNDFFRYDDPLGTFFEADAKTALPS